MHRFSIIIEKQNHFLFLSLFINFGTSKYHHYYEKQDKKIVNYPEID